MIIRKAVRFTNKSAIDQQRMRAIQSIESKCCDPNKTWQDFSICPCKVCSYKQRQEQPKGCFKVTRFDHTAFQRLLKLVVRKGREPDHLKFRIADIVFISNGKPTNMYIWDEGYLQVRKMVMGELTETLLLTNKSGAWLLRNNSDYDLRIICQSQMLHYLRPGSKNRPLRMTHSIQNYLQEDPTVSQQTIHFKQSHDLQQNLLYRQAKANALFNEDRPYPKGKVCLGKAYELVCFMQSLRECQVVEMQLQFSIKNDSPQLIGCSKFLIRMESRQPASGQQSVCENLKLAQTMMDLYSDQKSSWSFARHQVQPQSPSQKAFRQLYGEQQNFSKLMESKQFKADIYRLRRRRRLLMRC